MTDNDLVCNFKKCRKRLTNTAWVTSCSHTFCDEDGSREFNKSLVCPACDAKLNGKHDIVRHDLKPSEQYKSMILAGLKPETIMEIASRAISFWTYQAQQEKLYQEYSAKKTKESSDKLEAYYEQLVNKLQSEMKSIKVDLGAKTKDLGETKQRFNELKEQHQEKSRQHQKLQIMYDTLRRRSINPASLKEFQEKGAAPNNTTNEKLEQQQNANSKFFQMSMGTNFLGSTRNIHACVQEAHQSLFAPFPFAAKHPNETRPSSPPTTDTGFVMKPFPTPQAPQEGTDFGQRFTLHLNTPRTK